MSEASSISEVEGVIFVDTPDTPTGFRRLRACCCTTKAPHIAFRAIAWVFWIFFLLIAGGAIFDGLWFYDEGGFCPIDSDISAFETNNLPWFMVTAGAVMAAMAIPKFVDLGIMNNRCYKHHPDCVLGFRIVLNTYLILCAIGLFVWLGVGAYWAALAWINREDIPGYEIVCVDEFIYSVVAFICLIVFFYIVAFFLAIFFICWAWYKSGR